jgi:signal transduction histidine kinase
MLRGKIILLLCGVACVGGALFWILFLIFANELRDVSYEQIQRHTQTTADAIARDTRAAFDDGVTIDPLNNQWIDAGLADLMRAQAAVKAAMIADLQDRVYLLKVEKTLDIDRLFPAADSPQGLLAEDLIEAMKGIYPQSEQTNINLFQPNTRIPMARLYIFYDATPPRDVVMKAATRAAAFLTLFFLLLGAGAGAYAMQRRAARRFRRQRDQAEQLAYVGTLAAGLAHEIRNPLNALAMQLEMLEEDVARACSPRDAGRIQRIREGLVGVERTVSEFLNYAAPGQQKPAWVDLSDQLERIRSEFVAERPDAPGRVECNIAPGLKAWCDINALRQILGNLLGNAWSVQKDGARRLRLEAAREGDWVTIAVDDAGPGIAEGEGEQIFECFYSTRGGGTGLGLPIARRLAEMNGGRLDLVAQRSVMGGARFEVRLPGRQPAGRPRLAGAGQG